MNLTHHFMTKGDARVEMAHQQSGLALQQTPLGRPAHPPLSLSGYDHICGDD